MKLVKEFQNKFKKENLYKISVDDYVLGKNKDTFCYWVENKLNDYGDIHGSTAKKFGIYYGKTNKDSTMKYRWSKKFSKNVNNENDVMNNIGLELSKLVNKDNTKKINLLAKNIISPMFKLKILSLYYPKEFIPIYSDEHLKRILNLFQIKYNTNNNVLLNNKLLQYKNDSDVLSLETNFVFSNFLYITFNDYIRDLIDPKKIEMLTEVHFNNLILKDTHAGGEGKLKKRDYERINKAKHIQGLKAELLVVKHESQGNVIVKHVSLKDDSLGYDIEVLDKHTKKTIKYIEVKSSAKGSLDNINFYITINELEKMNNLENYFIYYVFNLKREPRFIKISKEDIKVNPKPVLFRFELKDSNINN